MFLGQKLQLLPLEVRRLLVPERGREKKCHVFSSVSVWTEMKRGERDSQLDDDGPRFDLVHLHEGETLCAGEPLLGFVVLEFEEDSCSCRNAKRRVMRIKRLNIYLGSLTHFPELNFSAHEEQKSWGG